MKIFIPKNKKKINSLKNPNIISKFEMRITLGTRNIVHLEAMMLEILTLLYKNNTLK